MGRSSDAAIAAALTMLCGSDFASVAFPVDALMIELMKAGARLPRISSKRFLTLMSSSISLNVGGFFAISFPVVSVVIGFSFGASIGTPLGVGLAHDLFERSVERLLVALAGPDFCAVVLRGLVPPDL